MALAALIFACRTLEEEGAPLAANLPLAGRSLIEYQVRQAVSVGARHVVVLVERLPIQLVDAIDDLRDDGLAVEIARTPAEAADSIHPEETLLIIGDGVVADEGSLAEIACAPLPAISTVPESPSTRNFERIDGEHRWAGLALIDGSRLRATTQMLGEWDLETTLVRRAVQEHARRIDIGSGGGSVRPVLAASIADLDDFEQTVVAASTVQRRGWPDRWIFPQIERLLVPPLLGRVRDPIWLGMSSALAALISLVLAAIGWLGTAILCALISGPLLAIAVRIARARLAPLRLHRAIAITRIALMAVALLAAGYRQTSGGQLVWLLVVVAVLLVQAAVGRERDMIERIDGPVSDWNSTADGLAWAMMPLFLLAGAGWAMLALLAYAAVSFAFLQHRLSRNLNGSARG